MEEGWGSQGTDSKEATDLITGKISNKLVNLRDWDNLGVE